MQEESIIALSAPRERISPVTHVRGTLLASSLRTLRGRNQFERYLTLLPAAHHDSVLSTLAGSWSPIEVAIAHYEACDRLALSHGDLIQMGMDVGESLRGTFLASIFKVAADAGFSPWSTFAQYQRLWERLMKGGSIGVYKLGPKEGRVEIVGLPLARIPYFRVAFRGVNQLACQLFCKKAYITDIPKLCTDTTLAVRVSWA
jgi:hypothetical protein